MVVTSPLGTMNTWLGFDVHDTQIEDTPHSVHSKYKQWYLLEVFVSALDFKQYFMRKEEAFWY